MKKLLVLVFGLRAVCAVFAGGDKEVAAGDGAKSILINPPVLIGFPDADASVLPGDVADTIRRNFTKYSGMRVVIEGNADYYLKGKLEKVDAGKFTIRLTVDEEKTGGNFDALATSELRSAYSLTDLKYGNVVNLATKDLFESPKLGVKLTATERKKLTEPVDTRLAEGQSAMTRASAAPEASFKREQNANIAEASSVRLPSAQFPKSTTTDFVLPKFKPPASFTPLTFKPPVVTPFTIKTFSTSTTVAGMQSDLARYREIQAANKAAVEKQQQNLSSARGMRSLSSGKNSWARSTSGTNSSTRRS
jgi:hypothetical protein